MRVSVAAAPDPDRDGDVRRAEPVASYPPLGVEDVRAATACAADLAREPIVETDRCGVA